MLVSATRKGPLICTAPVFIEIMGFRVPPLLSFLNLIAMPDLLQINPALFEIVAEKVLQLTENLEHEFEVAY